MSHIPASEWPTKSRELHNHHMNSALWNGFQFRDDDIVVATYAKSGTTWVQWITAQLVFGGPETINLSAISPWVDLRYTPQALRDALDSQVHRRIMKTHLPIDALVFSPKAKYLYVARDGRDTLWSLYNHHSNLTDAAYKLLNDTPGLVGPPLGPPLDSVRSYFLRWLDQDGYPYWPYWNHIRGWWTARHLPNVKLMHFNDLKVDLESAITTIGAFLNISLDASALSRISQHCTFEHMKAHAESAAPRGGVGFKGGAQTFINKGTNGRWRDELTAEDIAMYESRALFELGPECAAWLKRGGTIS